MKLFHFIVGVMVKMSLVFPKTSTFKELKNKPVTKITLPNFSNEELSSVTKTIDSDVNFRIYGVNKELSLLIQTLIRESNEVLLLSMDFIVISKMGLEFLVVENNTKSGFDRSVFIDLTSYRSFVFQFHFFFSIILGLIVLFATGDEALRDKILSLFSAHNV